MIILRKSVPIQRIGFSFEYFELVKLREIVLFDCRRVVGDEEEESIQAELELRVSTLSRIRFDDSKENRMVSSINV